jgi:hypothetical protein
VTSKALLDSEGRAASVRLAVTALVEEERAAAIALEAAKAKVLDEAEVVMRAEADIITGELEYAEERLHVLQARLLPLDQMLKPVGEKLAKLLARADLTVNTKPWFESQRCRDVWALFRHQLSEDADALLAF